MMVGEQIRIASSKARRFTPGEWALLAPFGVFCFVYPWAILLMSLDLMPFGMEWMSSLLLAMLGLTAGAWMWLNYGAAGAGLSALVFGFGLALEYVGVTTGVPFGAYRYTGVLVPGLPGGVPAAIGFAWVFIIVAGLFTAQWLLVRRLSAVVCVAGAVLAVGLDLLLEPVAYHVKDYWQWLADPGGGYYGVPWSNFAAWFLAALVMNGLVAAVLRRAPLRWLWVPPVLYAMNVALFGIVNVAHGMWVPGLVGVGLLALQWWGWKRSAREPGA